MEDNTIPIRSMDRDTISFVCLLFVLWACHSSDTRKTGDAKKPAATSENYKIQLVDSIKVAHVGRLLPVDYNRITDNLLFFDVATAKIIETDQSGGILHTFSAKGQSDKDYGLSLSNLGYFNDTCIVASGSMGYCFYKTDGTFLKRMDAKNGQAHAVSLMGGERIREVYRDGRPVLISWFFKDFSKDNTTKQYYEQNRLLTFYDLQKGESSLEIGYEPGSVFRQYEHSYVTGRFTYFDVNEQESALYAVHTPDTRIYKYSLKKGDDAPELVRNIDTRLRHFVLPYKVAFGSGQEDSQRTMSVNSTISSINSTGDYLLISYHTLLPEDVYARSHSTEELAEAWKKHHKCYVVLFKDDVQVSTDVELPSVCGDVAFFKSPDYIFMKTNTDISEPDNYSMFYIGSLVKQE